MPTFTLSGFQVTRNATDTVVAVDPLSLSVFVPEGQTTFSYSILGTEPDDIPEVDITSDAVSVIASGPGVPGGVAALPDDSLSFLGTVTTSTGTHTLLVFEVEQDDGSFLDAFFQIGGDPLAVPGSVTAFQAIEDGVTQIGAATGAFAPGATISFSSLANTTEEAGPNQVVGTDSDDVLPGTAGDDLIVTGNATPNGDQVDGSAGDDVIDMSGNDGVNGFVTLNYSALDSGIAVTIDGVAETGTVNKGANGTDTLIGVEQPLFAGFGNGGLGVIGTSSADSFTLAPGANQWMQVRGGDGADSYEISGDGLVRLDFASTGATGGAQVNFATGAIADDGFGNAETITGTSNVWEVRGTANADAITGGAADESFISRGGDDTIDGGDGFDRLRYDRSGVGSASVDLAAGTATGSWDGVAFTNTISNIEWVRGSNSADTLAGDTNENRLDGRGGTDTFVHVGGNDTIGDFDAATETLIVRVAGLTQAQV
ncbi:Ca2+-binding RTX toxin-like protein, partial [Roseovarius sp. MBR-78]